MRAWVWLPVLLAWLPAGVRAKTTVRVVETWPAGDTVTLGRQQNFYLRLAYTTDEPAHLWIEPYFHGERVDAGTHPSPSYSGSGEAFGWFFLVKPGAEVDEVRILAGDGSPGGTHLVASYPVDVAGSDAPVAATEPDWVVRMKQRAEVAQRQAYAEAMNQPMSAGDVALFSGFMLLMLVVGLLAFVAPAWAVWRWQGGWRLAAAVPLAVMAFVVLRIVLGALVDPTSHNLWPFEVLQAGVPCVLAIGAMFVVRRFTGGDRR